MTDPIPKPKPPVPAHEHVFDDRWYPLDKRHVRRVCTYPRCTERQVREVLG